MGRAESRTKLKRITAEGRVWEVICRSVKANDFKWTVRNIARYANLSLGAVHSTYAWKVYSAAKRDERSRRKALAGVGAFKSKPKKQEADEPESEQ
ncbi:hypothetical protein RAS2_00480 [Phycisphaerae bacterium RAS2]|nr:hypothetical protein RAS2_00480 [Phycisphaerae bacterium RAS2]